MIERLRAERPALLALLILPVIAFAPAVFFQRVFAIKDLNCYFFPYRALAAEMIKAGELPLWNPYAFGGIPFLGDGQTALLFPPNWLSFFLPAHWALNYTLILQFWIAAIAFYCLSRSFDLDRIAALIGAASFSLSGFLVARVVHPSIQGGAAMLPLVFLCVDRALRTASSKWSAAASVTIAIQVFAGHPQPVIYTLLATAVYAVLGAGDAGQAFSLRGVVHRAIRLTAIYALGFALATVQLLPWMELGSQSPRAAFASPYFLFSSASRLGDYLLLVFPYLFGSLAGAPFGLVDRSTEIRLWEHSIYIGILPFSLCILALLEAFADPSQPAGNAPGVRPTMPQALARRRQLLSFFLLLAAVSFLLTTAASEKLLNALPLVNKFRNPERIGMLLVFSLSVLAALAYEGVVRPVVTGLPRRQRQIQVRVCVTVLCLILLGAAAVTMLPRMQDFFGVTSTEIANFRLSRPNWYLPAMLTAAAAVLLSVTIKNGHKPVLQVLSVALVFADMISFAVSFQPLSQPQVLTAEPAAARILRADESIFRKATIISSDSREGSVSKAALAMNWSGVYGIEDINGFNSLQPRRHMDFLFSPDVEDISYGLIPWKTGLRDKLPLLNLLNVKYVLFPRGSEGVAAAGLRELHSDGDVTIYENLLNFPRAFFVERVIAEQNPRSILRAIQSPNFDGRRTAYIEAPVDVLPSLSSPGCCDTVKIVDRNAVSIHLSTSTSGTRFLFVSEMYFPGWRAYIDGQETAVHRSNYLFRGVVVPPGVHSLVFRYSPWSIRLGGITSLTAALLCAGIICGYRRRTRPVPHILRD